MVTSTFCPSSYLLLDGLGMMLLTFSLINLRNYLICSLSSSFSSRSVAISRLSWLMTSIR